MNKKPTAQDETHDGRFQAKKPTAEEVILNTVTLKTHLEVVGV